MLFGRLGTLQGQGDRSSGEPGHRARVGLLQLDGIWPTRQARVCDALVAALGYVGIARSDAVRIVCLQQESGSSVSRRRASMPDLVQQLSRGRRPAGSTSTRAWAPASRMPRGQPMVVVVSDLLTPDGVSLGLGRAAGPPNRRRGPACGQARTRSIQRLTGEVETRRRRDERSPRGRSQSRDLSRVSGPVCHVVGRPRSRMHARGVRYARLMTDRPWSRSCWMTCAARRCCGEAQATCTARWLCGDAASRRSRWSRCWRRRAIYLVHWFFGSRRRLRVSAIFLWADPAPVVDRPLAAPLAAADPAACSCKLLGAVLAVLALARPATPSDRPRHVALVLDASGSMQATDVRADPLRRRARPRPGPPQHPAAVRPGDASSALDARPRYWSAARLMRRAERLPRPSPTRVGPRSARRSPLRRARLPRPPDRRGEIVLLTDAAWPPLDPIGPLAAPVDVVAVGGGSENQAITTVNVRMDPTGRGQTAFVELANMADHAARIPMRLTADGAAD